MSGKCADFRLWWCGKMTDKWAMLIVTVFVCKFGYMFI